MTLLQIDPNIYDAQKYDENTDVYLNFPLQICRLLRMVFFYLDLIQYISDVILPIMDDVYLILLDRRQSLVNIGCL